ncbi:MAG: stage V sporulation protein AC [Eubacteriales bacterium]|nr:stage V sporulation protein AC [Eubacteriales bacterium]
MMTKQAYSKLVKEKSKGSSVVKNCIWAFLVGGLICALGEGIAQLFLYLKLEEKDARTLTSVVLVFLGVLLTALGLYEKLAKHAGAGTLVPITGFANSVASPAIEFKSEGFVLGVGAKMFTIAGPVIVYGISAGMIYGLIYWFFTQVIK